MLSESGPNSRVFDETAAGWTAAIDKSIENGHYLRGKLFVNAAVNHVERGGSILDYGCGPGRISLMLAQQGFRVLGVDPSPAMIAMARQQSSDILNVEFRVCSECPSEIPAVPHAAIVCSSVIQYVEDPELLLHWFSAALRPSGILIISFGNSDSLWGTWCRLRYTSPFLPAQKHGWSWPQFRRLLDRCGFAPESRPLYFEWPLDRIAHFRVVGRSALGGTLGLSVARNRRSI